MAFVGGYRCSASSVAPPPCRPRRPHARDRAPALTGCSRAHARADDEDFKDQLKKVDAAGMKLKGVIATMQKGECSPLDCVKPLSMFKRAVESFVVETNDLDDGVASTSYPAQCLGGGKHQPKDLAKRFKGLQRECSDQIERAKKGDLKKGAAAGFDSQSATAGQMVDEAQRIQGKDLDAVKRMQRIVGQTEEVAASTMETMRDQTEQIGKIHQDLEEIDDTLKMAQTELTRYMRRLATDKVILGFIGMIVIGILVIIILHAFGVVDDDQVNAPDIVPEVDRDLIGRRRRQLLLQSILLS
jgi:hypothetical protein